MALLEKEEKLLRLALNVAAAKGEVENCAVMLIRSLRKRAATIEDFAGFVPNPDLEPSKMDFGLFRCPLKKFRDKPLKECDPGYLIWALGWIRGDPGLTAKFSDFAEAIEKFMNQ